MPFGSGGLVSQESSVAHSCFLPRGATVPLLTATLSGFESRLMSAITTSSGFGEWRRGGPIGYGWWARTSKCAGELLQRTFLSALRPDRQNRSRHQSAGATRWPPGGSPNGEVPAVTTTLVEAAALRPVYAAFS